MEGDTVLVYNNEEVPADMILISTYGEQAFFDTVNLDGESVLSEKFTAGKNFTVEEL